MSKQYVVDLNINATDKYKRMFETIVFDWPGVSDNIAYHFIYLEYLYQLNKQIDLSDYQFINGLRLKTIICELAAIAEVLLYDALNNLHVIDKWRHQYDMNIKKKVTFQLLLSLSKKYDVIPDGFRGRLCKLFELRHRIHLTHGDRDPFGFNRNLLGDSQKTIEDLVLYFISNRKRQEINREFTIQWPWNI